MNIQCYNTSLSHVSPGGKKHGNSRSNSPQRTSTPISRILKEFPLLSSCPHQGRLKVQLVVKSLGWTLYWFLTRIWSETQILTLTTLGKILMFKGSCSIHGRHPLVSTLKSAQQPGYHLYLCEQPPLKAHLIIKTIGENRLLWLYLELQPALSKPEQRLYQIVRTFRTGASARLLIVIFLW